MPIKPSPPHRLNLVIPGIPDNTPLGHISADHASGADHAVIRDISSFKDDDIASNPAMLTNMNFSIGIPLFFDRGILSKSMVMVVNLYAFTKEAPPPISIRMFAAIEQSLLKKQLLPILTTASSVFMMENPLLQVTSFPIYNCLP